MTNNTSDGGQPFVPLGLEGEELERFTALRDDIPPWLQTSLWDWIKREFTRYARGGNSVTTFSNELVREVERKLHVPIGWDGTSSYDTDNAFWWLKNAFSDGGPVKTWRLVDYLLGTKHDAQKQRLGELLTEAGSAWTLGQRNGRPGLIKRLPSGVAEAALAVFQHGDAGRRLESAWASAFGINPDPETAYSRAVKAVEYAAIPVVSPNDGSATLGKLIGQIAGGGQFNIPGLREHTDAKTHDVLIGMMRLLWTGQSDRHGGPSSVSVTQEQAEAAVMLAVTLVGWFETGKVVR
ncbi:hypothetical protein CH302_17070 [Rhodococcus sp. 15-2388-1-1a]|uniref:hypothetical protein n=1 Tax=Nocardiaceae TaxID=85025 RepID=UPI000559C3B6|nr:MULTISPECIES: hypothetical protein [Rhodococcus]OZE95532.1 hypothetical protein CH302_17070 [Rhodococcus sp. 15-2388-1-1a]